MENEEKLRILQLTYAGVLADADLSPENSNTLT